MLWNYADRKAILLCVAAILIFVSPLFLLGDDAHIRVHDNLDSNLAWYKVLAASGQMFGGVHAVIPQIIGGLPRDALGTEWTLIVWLHTWFPTMTAYAISQLLTRLIAFLGMYLLLRTHVIRNIKAHWIAALVSLAFALTPFWPSGMLSTMGHPLALWAFLSIRSKKANWVHWTAITLLPLYASFVLGFFFFLALMGIVWLIDLLRYRRLNLLFLASIIWMTAVFLATDYRLVYTMIAGSETMHRVEFVSSRQDFVQTLRLFWKNFTLGHNHVMTLHTFVILPVLVIALFLVLFSRGRTRPMNIYLGLTGFNLLLSFWYALWFNKIWRIPKEHIDLLSAFNFARFHFLRPLVIYVSFGLACYLLWQLGKRSIRVFVYACLCLQLVILALSNEEIVYGLHQHTPSVEAFYAVDQFEEIRDYIGQPQDTYKVASIGLHPAIAQYNGFYTVDTYNNIIPLSYKHQFREVIAGELAKSKNLTRYFDEWGSRLYIFSAELGKHYDFRKDSNRTIHDLDLNAKALRELGGAYVLSSVLIENAIDNDLHFERSFEHPDSAWKVHLYRVQP
ncbi:hypothetical protein CHH69_07055 [Terribacillus saccharophilus]|uniref:YkoS n=1 Tax=Terribacillus saccharophilus TaxID=361277 RepID=A0A268AFV4_9BACI|nr:hypothetical protein CHH64_01130 [Terribacillus saccharophilus]PAF19096.1 hypothetical protein CHH51_05135 [Terribacillus saccharophilus]PAF23693.1 hypothetical protein CHH49_01430 [Terribacillus saccharophilus]PAF37591.1 hypothetical protein CHH58_08760 [Terribacillus saccharophilus]PAF39677.1 hypothetical protein CHH69_07055 [Terribacillus saccharophilus]